MICEDLRKTTIPFGQSCGDTLQVDPQFRRWNAVKADQMVLFDRLDCRLSTECSHERSKPSGDDHLDESAQRCTRGIEKL
jgi:hypothetical protein